MRFFIFITAIILFFSSCEEDGNRKLTLEDFTRKIVELNDSIVSVEYSYKDCMIWIDSLILENDNQIEDINAFRLGYDVNSEIDGDMAYTKYSNVLVVKSPCIDFFYWCRKTDVEKYKIIVYSSLY